MRKPEPPEEQKQIKRIIKPFYQAQMRLAFLIPLSLGAGVFLIMWLTQSTDYFWKLTGFVLVWSVVVNSTIPRYMNTILRKLVVHQCKA